MSKSTRYLFILAALLMTAALCGCSAALLPAAAAEEAPAAEPSPTATAEPVQTPAPALLTIADQSAHPALITPDEDGFFRSAHGVCRVSACEALYSLLEGCPNGYVVMADVKRWNDGYDAIAALYSAGALPVEVGGDFRPADWITRQELTEIMDRLSLCLTGAEAKRASALAADIAAGSTANPASGGAGLISRAEFAVILERLAGREPDDAALFTGGYLPADIGKDSFAWNYIADAVTEGEIAPAEPGVYRIGGALYAVGDDGALLADIDYGVWTFGLDGTYTTGSEELDGYLAEVLEACGANDLPQEEALEAAFLYIKYNYEYLVQPEDMETLDPGTTGWEYDRALRFFQNGGGTCYGYAAAFGLLARALGEHAYIVAAEVNQYYAPHGFVVVPSDGIDWIYDVEMEATRQERHADLDLFHIQNHAVYNYWYTPDW